MQLESKHTFDMIMLMRLRINIWLTLLRLCFNICVRLTPPRADDVTTASSCRVVCTTTNLLVCVCVCVVAIWLE